MFDGEGPITSNVSDTHRRFQKMVSAYHFEPGQGGSFCCLHMRHARLEEKNASFPLSVWLNKSKVQVGSVPALEGCIICMKPRPLQSRHGGMAQLQGWVCVIVPTCSLNCRHEQKYIAFVCVPRGNWTTTWVLLGDNRQSVFHRRCREWSALQVK